MQFVVALSTTKVEYMSATHSCKENIWLKRLFGGLGVKQNRVIVHCDIQSALHLVKSPRFHAQTKYIDVQCHFVRETLENGLIVL